MKYASKTQIVGILASVLFTGVVVFASEMRGPITDYVLDPGCAPIEKFCYREIGNSYYNNIIGGTGGKTINDLVSEVSENLFTNGIGKITTGEFKGKVGLGGKLGIETILDLNGNNFVLDGSKTNSLSDVKGEFRNVRFNGSTYFGVENVSGQRSQNEGAVTLFAANTYPYNWETDKISYFSVDDERIQAGFNINKSDTTEYWKKVLTVRLSITPETTEIQNGEISIYGENRLNFRSKDLSFGDISFMSGHGDSIIDSQDSEYGSKFTGSIYINKSASDISQVMYIKTQKGWEPLGNLVTNQKTANELSNQIVTPETQQSAFDYIKGVVRDMLTSGVDFIKAKTVKTENLSVKNGIEMIDTVTGMPYCTAVTNGVLTTTQGSCGMVTVIAVPKDPKPVLVETPVILTSTPTPEGQAQPAVTLITPIATMQTTVTNADSMIIGS
jgi:hypothetical protein